MKPMRVGDAEVWSLIEREGPLRSPETMFPDADPERIIFHLRNIDSSLYERETNRLFITYQTFVIKTPRYIALIDTCVGDHPRNEAMSYPKAPWLDAFRSSGLKFEQIDYVFCTHLHIDHVGWNTLRRDGRLVPTFPNASYIFSRRDFEFWSRMSETTPHPAGAYFRECVLPVVESGQAKLVDENFVINDELRISPASGHSPGQICVHLSSRGQEAIFTGDLMHHMLQCLEPDWSTCFCFDRIEAASTRRRILEECADRDVLLFPTHFPSPTVGRVKSSGTSFKFCFGV